MYFIFGRTINKNDESVLLLSLLGPNNINQVYSSMKVVFIRSNSFRLLVVLTFYSEGCYKSSFFFRQNF